MITQKQYNEMLDSFNDEDWKNIRRRMEEKLPETKLWTENLFRSYCTTVVRWALERKDSIDMKKLEKLGFKKITEPGFTV
jgi:hypothetical protein